MTSWVMKIGNAKKSFRTFGVTMANKFLKILPFSEFWSSNSWVGSNIKGHIWLVGSRKFFWHYINTIHTSNVYNRDLIQYIYILIIIILLTLIYKAYFVINNVRHWCTLVMSKWINLGGKFTIICQISYKISMVDSSNGGSCVIIILSYHWRKNSTPLY